MASITRVFAGDDGAGDFVEMEFTVDEDGDIWITEDAGVDEANSVFLPGSILDKFLERREAMLAAAQ